MIRILKQIAYRLKENRMKLKVFLNKENRITNFSTLWDANEAVLRENSGTKDLKLLTATSR